MCEKCQQSKMDVTPEVEKIIASLVEAAAGPVQEVIDKITQPLPAFLGPLIKHATLLAMAEVGVERLLPEQKSAAEKVAASVAACAKESIARRDLVRREFASAVQSALAGKPPPVAAKA